MPVYNGRQFIEQALDSLLAQTFTNYELLISDNASSDDTEHICAEYRKRDPRIKYFRHLFNQGASANFNFVAQKALGEYFMWAGHDDFWELDFIAQCVTALDDNPGVVLCSSDVQFIDSGGNAISGDGLSVIGFQYNKLDTFGMTVQERVKELTAKLNWYTVYGVVRSAALRKTRLFTEHFGADVILLMELLLQGQTFILPERLFNYRLIPKSFRQAIEAKTPDAIPDVAKRPYTRLVKSLSNVIADSKFDQPLKNIMIEDLINNAGYNTVLWRDCILRENSRWAHLYIRCNPYFKQLFSHIVGAYVRRSLRKQLHDNPY